MIQQNRGQAAMEFLMTYGWAILAAIVAIGVLAYFGVFNPSRLAGSTAVINAPLNIPVGGFNIVSDDVTCTNFDCFHIAISQNAANSIAVSGATITLTGGLTGTCSDTVTLPTSWAAGTSQTFDFNCGAANLFGKGDMARGNLEITYTVGSSTITQSSTGTINGIAQ